MYILDFEHKKKVHFIGIGGISMSGLAKLLLSKGMEVSGSDWKSCEQTEELESLGATINYGENSASNITDDVDVVIYTAAVKPDNPELVSAKEKGIPAITRAELMGLVMKHYPNSIGIAGTHGKTTTTGLLSMVLLEAGLDPTIAVGGVIPELQTNFKIGQGDYMVVEACEYTNSFLSFYPTDEIILNVEADHLDFFKDLDDIRNSFAGFVELVPEGGVALVNSEIPDYGKLFEKASCKILTYGLCEHNEGVTSYDYAAADITYDEMNRGSFLVYEKGEKLGRIKMGLRGRHNVSNALPVIALALRYGVSFTQLAASLERFTGTKRRFEYKGEFQGAALYDDYAHHPTEIRATLTTAAKCEHKRIITVFQPHTFSRTKALLNDFADALSLSDIVVLAKIYPAREIDDGTISSDDIRKLIEKQGTKAYYLESFSEIEKFLKKLSTPGDLLITMGAGDVVNIGSELLSE